TKDNQILFDLAPVVTVGTANPVTIDGTAGTIGGLTNKTWDPAAITSGQAATEDQLKLASTALTDTGINIAADNGSPDTVKLGETVTYTSGDKNIVTTVSDNQIDYKLAPVVTVGTANPITINGNTGVIGGLTNTTWNPTSVVSGQAATEDQLLQATNSLTATGINITAQGGTADNVKLGETVDYSNTDNNIVVSKGADNQVLFNLAPVVTVGTTNPVVVDGNTGSLTVGSVTNPITISSTTGTINGLDNITWNPAAITSGQAATEDQLKLASAAAKTTVTAGDNIVVTPTSNTDGSTTYQVATAKNVSFDSVKVGSVSIDSTKVDAAGNTIISGVGAGAVSATSTDAINGSQLYNLGTGVQNIIGGTTTYDPITGTYVNNNIGGTGKGNINDAIASVGDAATKAKTTVTAGSNVVVTPSLNADGSNNYEVAVANDLNVNSVTSNAVTVGSVGIDKNNADAAGNTIISGVGAGAISATSTDAVNGSQLYATNQQVTQNTTDITNISTALDKGMSFSADSGTAVSRKLGDTVAITGDGNITTTTTANGVQLKLSDNLNVDNVTVNQNFSVAEGATVNMGGNVIQNVAPGVNGTDAVNVNQLNNVTGNLSNRITNVGHIANAGVAQAIATAGLPQAYLPGKNMMAVAGGTYQGETGYAVGFSTISDNGKWIIKATGSGNSRGKYGASIGAGYQW
ncbi:MAG: hypothetical protein H6R05_529, partial [Burkholderiaceae bacterium]|nr:hypothetical protein [Burkholderiaceae bacterium]